MLRFIKHWLKLFLLFYCSYAQAQSQEHTGNISIGLSLPHYDTNAILTSIKKSDTQKNTDSAIAILKTALNQSLSANFCSGVKRSLYQLLPLMDKKATTEERNAILANALYQSYYSKHLQGALPAIYSAIATGYQWQGQYETAAQYYLKAISIAKEHDSASLPALYSNYGSLLGSLTVSTGSDNQQAMYYLDKAGALAQINKDFNARITVSVNKGNIYQSNQNYRQARNEFQDALAIAQKHNFVQWQYVALTNLGNLYYTMGKPKEALPYLRKAFTIKDEKISPFFRNAVLMVLGKVYYDLKDNDNAARWLQAALSVADSFNIGKDKIEAHKMLALLYDRTGNYKNAFKHQFTLQKLTDSLRSKEITDNLQQEEVKYRTAEKDKQLLKNQLHIEQQARALQDKNVIILLVAVLVLILVLISIVIYGRMRQKQKLLLRDEQIKEMKALMSGEEKERTRLAQELHDGIGGMLAAINMNMNVASNANFENKAALHHIMKMIIETTDEVRKAAHNLMPSALLRHNLKDALQHYCNNINKNGTLLIDLNVHGNLNGISVTHATMLFRITQELIQNIIKHANATHAIVELERTNNYIQLLVEDNGDGFDMKQKTLNLGLENLRFRINTMRGKLHIESQPGTGTSITVTFENLQ